MKLRLKFDKKAVSQFFIDHSEKIVLAGVALCFLVVAYHAITRQGFTVQGKSRQESTPENLKLAVDAAEKNLHQDYDLKRAFNNPQIGDFKFEQTVNGGWKTINPKDYEVATAFFRPVSPSTVLRGMPTVLPVERLVATVGRGPVAADRDVRAGAGQAGGDTVHGQRWVLLKGLVPIRKQAELYQGLYGNATYQEPARDHPVYAGFIVQRAEVTPGSSAAEKWDKRFPWAPQTTEEGGHAKAIGRQGGDVVDGKFYDEALCCPLPGVTDRTWGPEAAYLPEIPLAEPEGKDGRRPPLGKEPLPKPFPVDDPFHARTPGKSRLPAGQPQAEEDKGPEYKLLRFLDYEAEPGKQYRYRVFLVLKNPNYDMDDRVLKDPDSAKKEFIGLDSAGGLADWSAPSPVVAMPNDVQLLAFGVQTPRPGQEPTGLIRVVSWSKNLGINAWHEFSVVRGKIADFSHIESDTLDGRIPVDYLSGDLIVDLAADRIAPKDYRVPVRASQILVLESGRLVIRDKDADEERFNVLVPKQIKLPPNTPPGKTEKEIKPKRKTQEGGFEDLDNSGIFGKDKPSGKPPKR